MMFPVVFLSEMTLDWVWSGPITMGDLFTVPPGVVRGRQVLRTPLEASNWSQNLQKIILTTKFTILKYFISLDLR